MYCQEKARIHAVRITRQLRVQRRIHAVCITRQLRVLERRLHVPFR